MSQMSGGSSTRRIAREELQEIASRQKAILICILLYLIAVLARFLLPADMRPVLGIGVLLLVIVATVFVFMLAIKLYGKGVGIVLGILTLIPLIGLIVLLIVNAKATGVLRENGIAVGLLGAKGVA